MPSVGLTPYVIEGFGGLNLRSDPEEAGASAIDGLDFDLSPGVVRSRDGWAKFTVAAAAAYYDVLHAHGPLLFARQAGSGAVDAITASTLTGAVLNSTTMKATAYGLVSYGTPSGGYVFGPAATGSTTNIVRHDGASWSTVAAGHQASYIAVTPGDNRLVLLAEIAPGTFDSRVRFSDSGDPTTWGANNYVDLHPGDGQAITGACVWREMMFVFKRTKFDVFYGQSVDASGNPVFNYRTVDTGKGIAPAGSVQGCAAGPDGVYFVHDDGIYRTSGGPAVKVSTQLDPLFMGHRWSYYTGSVPQFGGEAFVSAAGNRVYVTIDTGGTTPNLTLVYDVPTGQWLMWSIPATTFVALRDTAIAKQDRVFFGMGGFGGTNDVGVTDPTFTADNLAAINSYYRGGFSDFGLPAREKTIRQTELVGQGVVAFSWSRDMGTTMNTPSAANVTLGTSPATARGLHRNADHGELLSYKIASVNGGAWQINRVEPMIQSVRAAGAFS